MAETEKVPIHESFHSAVHAFIGTRLNAKLEKLSDDDPKRSELLSEHEPSIWIADAARRVQQIQAVTHSLKPIHPDARGTNLYVDPAQLAPLQELGSHALRDAFAGDVVGNAAALDVYKLLKLQVGQTTLLTALLANDAGALQALHSDPHQAQALRDAFVSLTQARTGAPSSHSRAKQLYWLTGDDACDDGHYALLAPLYATSLAHEVYGEIQEHRFGDANKAARMARRERRAHAGVFHDYPGLAVQKMGGTKPQNISQLNSERGGTNYLLSSLPPLWTPSAVRLPVKAESIFDKLFIARPQVRSTVRTLRQFLESDPTPNAQTREQRDGLLDTLVDELVALAGELQQVMGPGWSLDTSRFDTLNRAEQLWLDPLRAELADQGDFAQEWLRLDWPAEIGKRFGLWLNQQVKHRLPVGDVEARAWAKELLADEDGFQQYLSDMRRRLAKTGGSA